MEKRITVVGENLSVSWSGSMNVKNKDMLERLTIVCKALDEDYEKINLKKKSEIVETDKGKTMAELKTIFRDFDEIYKESFGIDFAEKRCTMYRDWVTVKGFPNYRISNDGKVSDGCHLWER